MAGESDRAGRGRAAVIEQAVIDRFQAAGWEVRPLESDQGGRPDFIIRKGRNTYVGEVKWASEGRADRLIPLWAQALLQAMRHAGGRHKPLAVVAAPRISRRVAEQVLTFAQEHAPNSGAGVADLRGLRRFVGSGLSQLDSEPESASAADRPLEHKPADLFSDLNQWLLKVLVAPELPPQLLTAPRHRYESISELARAAKVSPMTAFRFVRQLKAEGHLHESSDGLQLVRRQELFKRWESAARRPVLEVPMRFLLRRDPISGIPRLLHATGGCLGLFAAADALGFGYVHGVPPHVYVRRLNASGILKGLVPATDGESPNLIVREASFPESVFRGMVMVDDMPVADIVQVWLDATSHPARGEEQADLIRKKVLGPVMNAGGLRG